MSTRAVHVVGTTPGGRRHVPSPNARDGGCGVDGHVPGIHMHHHHVRLLQAQLCVDGKGSSIERVVGSTDVRQTRISVLTN